MENWKTGLFGRMLLTFFIFSGGLSAQTSPTLSVMPLPASVKFGEGWLSIGPSFRIYVQGPADSRVAHATDRLLKNLSSRTGFRVRNASDEGSSAFTVTYTDPGPKVQTLDEDESYRLTVTPADVHLEAPNPLGVLHGLQTFLQLVRMGPNGFAVPAVTIEDRPRFLWRGLLIDVSRH